MPGSTSSQSPPPVPRRRSSASPSPAAGVKGVTRKVIRTLEGLGHAVVETDTDDDPEESEVAEALRADRRHGKQRATMDAPETEGKIDWERPRKVSFVYRCVWWYPLFFSITREKNKVLILGFYRQGS
jgi:hypothetical protein